MAAAVSNLLHFDSTPGMVRAARVAHARSCARFEQQRAEQEARSASGACLSINNLQKWFCCC